MDIISHGLWGGIAFGKKSRKSFLGALFFGVAPDLFSFGPVFISAFLGITAWPAPRLEPPQDALIPSYVHSLYQITHSIIIFLAVFLLIAILLRRPLWEMLAWGLHILMDIPTHSYQFFPTPFLWPISKFQVDGIPWGHPEIFLPNIAALIVLYTWFFIKKRRGETHGNTRL